MSKVEILLVGVIILIVAGVGLYHFEDELFPKKQQVPLKAETVHYATQVNGVAKNNVSIGNMCIKTMEKALSVAEMCKVVYGKQEVLAREVTAATISNIKNPTKENQDAVNRYQREATDLDASMRKCSHFFPFVQKIKGITPLLQAGSFDDAQRLCLEINTAIPAGF